MVDPLGLVTKRRVWYLLADAENGRRSFRLDRMSAVRVTDEPFTPPERFDLDDAWSQVTTAYREQAGRVTTHATVDVLTLPRLREAGVEVTVVAEHDDGRLEVPLGAWSPQMLATKLAGMITGIDLVDPSEALTQGLARIGAELMSRFSVSDGPTTGSTGEG